jgi:hypothetical protein
LKAKPEKGHSGLFRFFPALDYRSRQEMVELSSTSKRTVKWGLLTIPIV